MKRFKLLILSIIGLFLFIPKNTFALENYSITPNEMHLFDDYNSNYSTLTMSTKSYIYNDYYGFDFQGTGQRIAIEYILPTGSIKDKAVNIDFVIHHSLKSNMINPLIVYLRDQNKNVTSCSVQSPQNLSFYKLYGMSGSLDTETQDFSELGKFSVVSCNNVVISSDYFTATIGSNFKTSPINENGFFGISSLHVVETTSNSEVAELQKQTEEMKKQTEESKKTNDLLESNDTSKSEKQANSFFNNFKDDDYGLSDVITMPLTFIKGLANNSCNSLNLPLPFVNKNAILPCMTSIYQDYFGSFLQIYQLITTGFISYWVCINIFALVQGFKNPDNDKVEVMEL